MHVYQYDVVQEGTERGRAQGKGKADPGRGEPSATGRTEGHSRRPRKATADIVREADVRLCISIYTGQIAQGQFTSQGMSLFVRRKDRRQTLPSQPLSSILNTSRVQSTPHTSEQITQLWNAYHMSRSGGTGRGFLCASIPLDLYKKMSAVAEKYPTFVIPIRRPRDASTPPVNGESDSAYEFYFLQWDFHDAPPVPSAKEDPFAKPPSSESPNPKISTVLFTPLEEYKLRNTFATPYLVLTNYTDLASTHGLVLLRGEITPSSGASGNYMLSQEDAQQLSMAIQKFYLWGNGKGEGEKLVKTFHEKPEEFKWEDLIRVADWGI